MPMLPHSFKRLLFTGKARIEFYEMLVILLESRELLIDALRTIRESSLGEMSPEQKKDPRTVDLVKISPFDAKTAAVQGLIEGLKAGDKDGFALSKGIRQWVPAEEAELIYAGERTGNLVSSLEDAIKNIEEKGKMLQAVMAGVLYPAGLFLAAYFVMRVFATKVIPRFEMQIPAEYWEGPAYVLYMQSYIFNHYGPYIVTAIIALIIASFASLPYLRGSLRVFLDRYVPPWNIYRMIIGAAFLKNIAVQTKAGSILAGTVSNMRENANPWLKQRLQATLYGLQQGKDLGKALDNAGYEFPDRRAVQILKVLASRDGFADTVYRFSERWTEATVKKVKAAAGVALILGLLTIGVVGGICITGMQGLTEIIEESADGAHRTGGG